MRKLIIAAAILYAIALCAAHAATPSVWTQSCGTHAGLYFCTQYQTAIPLPRARPVIACSTDTDCERKNGGDGY